MPRAESNKPAKMGVAFEDFAAVNADALENAVAVEQAVIVHADLGVFLVVEFAVDPDFEGHWELMIARTDGGRMGRNA